VPGIAQSDRPVSPDIRVIPEQIEWVSFGMPRVRQSGATVIGALVRHRCEVAYALGAERRIRALGASRLVGLASAPIGCSVFAIG